MPTKNELIEIRMKLLGAKEIAEGTGVAAKGLKGVGTAAKRTTAETSKASKATGVLTKGYSKLGAAAKYGLGFIGIGGVFALEKAVENTEELSKTTTGLNRNLGLSIEQGSRWAAVAQARGIATTALNMSFTKMGRTFVEANRKGGTARTALNQLGIGIAETEKGAHDFNYALELVGQQFGKAEAGPKRQAAAMALLGKGYSTVLPLFAQGNRGLKEQLGWADKYGVVLNGKTNDALMDMVNAQRESKVAMLGLQLSLTKALMPAIEGSEDQLHDFIATLNDPDLSADQKILRIEKQFEDIEDFLLKAISDALPRIAEQGGQLGVKLAAAIWTGFEHSNLAGKLVIGAWLFKFLGGFSLIGTLGAKVGGKLATSLGTKFLETVAPYFAAEAGVEGLGAALGSQMAGLRTLFAAEGAVLGTAMGVAAGGALAAELYFAVKWQKEHKLFDLLDLANPQSTDATTSEEEVQQLNEQGYTNVQLGWPNPNNITATDPKGHHVQVRKHGKHWITSPAKGRHHKEKRHPNGGGIEQRSNFTESPRGPQHIHLHVNGKEIAEAVVTEGQNQAAFR